jgi:hypothetical protein
VNVVIGEGLWFRQAHPEGFDRLNLKVSTGSTGGICWLSLSKPGLSFDRLNRRDMLVELVEIWIGFRQAQPEGFDKLNLKVSTSST